MKSFQGKVALITGGTSGIGRTTALAFAREGVRVVVTGRREKDGNYFLEKKLSIKRSGVGINKYKLVLAKI